MELAQNALKVDFQEDSLTATIGVRIGVGFWHLIAPTMDLPFLSQNFHYSFNSSCAVLFPLQCPIQCDNLPSAVFTENKNSWEALQMCCKSEATDLQLEIPLLIHRNYKQLKKETVAKELVYT